MENGYNFILGDIPNITLQLLIDSFAFQQASLSVIIEHLNLSEPEKEDIINEISEEKIHRKEEILQSLYESFGRTPDISL